MRRWLVVSDIHTDPVGPLLEECTRTAPDRIICLGDVERPGSLEALLNTGLPMLYTPGNHDYDLVRADVLPEWSEPRHAEVREFVRAACARDRDEAAGLEVTVQLGSQRCLLAHAWPGDLDNPWRERRHRTLYRLWRTVDDEGDLAMLFDYMEGHGYWLFLRGHQHGPRVCWRARCGREGAGTGEDLPRGALALERTRLYVITVGAYCLGRCALLEDQDDVAILRFKRASGPGVGHDA